MKDFLGLCFYRAMVSMDGVFKKVMVVSSHHLCWWCEINCQELLGRCKLNVFFSLLLLFLFFYFVCFQEMLFSSQHTWDFWKLNLVGSAYNIISKKWLKHYCWILPCIGFYWKFMVKECLLFWKKISPVSKIAWSWNSNPVYALPSTWNLVRRFSNML